MWTGILAVSGGVATALIGAAVTLYTRRPRRSAVELVDVSVVRSSDDEHPSLDIKVHNRGGESAFLKRLELAIDRSTYTRVPMRGLWAYKNEEHFHTPRFQLAAPTATYDQLLPEPDNEHETVAATNLSQVVEPGGVDRFMVRLDKRGGSASALYLLRPIVHYNADSRPLTSQRLAVGVPGMAPAGISAGAIERFVDSVRRIRRAIDDEMEGRGLPKPDWLISPPRRLGDLPSDLSSLTGGRHFAGPPGRLTDEFWNPEAAINDCLADVEKRCEAMLDIVSAADVVDEAVNEWVAGLRSLITSELPDLRSRCLAALTLQQ